MATKKSVASPRIPKTTFSLDSPYTEVKWPVISADDQAVVLELLCSLLTPLGEHRSHHTVPSKGKRDKKRKRKDKVLSVNPEEDAFCNEIPETPGIQQYITTGFNSTTKYLEALAQRSASMNTQSQKKPSSNVEKPIANPPEPDKPKPMAAVFVPGFGRPSILNSHLPLLIRTASLASASSTSPRLVSLSKEAEERLSAALSLPRAGLIGLIEGAPSTDTLVEFVRQQVPEVEVPWLHQSNAGTYLPVNIKAIQTSAPANPKKSKPS